MLDKIKVARSFSRSADTYDSVAYLQRDVGLALLTLLGEPHTQHEHYCIDLGCGTGYFYHHLKKRFPNLAYCGIDLAEGMLQYCQGHINDPLLCADAEALPIKDQSVSLLFSNMALQWCENLDALWCELDRVLLPGGLMAFTSLGNRTLNELKSAWARVDDATHVNRFTDYSVWREAILNRGFDIVNHQGKNHVLWYEELKPLLKELKLLGAHNVNEGQRSSLTGRRRIELLLRHYESFRQAKGLPATYEIDYWILRKPI